MSNYRRARVPGATYFFTLNLRDRRSDLLVREIDLLRATVRATQQQVAWTSTVENRFASFPPYVGYGVGRVDNAKLVHHRCAGHTLL